jgi:predicted MFS family arabinose efflux permease
MAGASHPDFETTPAYTAYVMALLFGVAVFALIDRQIVGMLIQPIKQEFGVSDTLLGLLTGPAFAVFYVLAGIPIARWADRGVRRSIIALGLLAWSTLTLASGLVTSFAQLVVARSGVGIGEAAGTPPSHALISDYVRPERRTTALAIYSLGSTVGVLLAYLIGGWIRDAYGWRMVFIALGAPGLLLAILIRLTVREPPRGRFEPAARAAPDPIGTALRSLLGMPTYRQVLIASALHSLAASAAGIWNPAFLERVHGMSGAQTGVTLALGHAPFSMLGMVASGWIIDRLARRDARWLMWYTGWSSIALAPFTLIFLLAPMDIALASMPLSALLTAAGIPGMHATNQALAKPSTRALASAVNLLLLSLIGFGLGSLVVGMLNDRLAALFGDQAVRYSLALVAVLSIWSGAHNLIAARTLREDLLRAREGSG